MRKIILITISIILGLFFASHIFCSNLAQLNFYKNQKIWNELNFNSIIHNQNDFDFLYYGLNNVGANGCGAVACYNILLLEDRYTPLPEIIRFFDNNKQNLYGYLGTSPFYVPYYLRQKGFEVNTYLNPKVFKEKAIASKYAILLYFNLEWGHYQLFTDYDGHTFQGYNSTGRYDFDRVLEYRKDFFKVLYTVN